MEAYISHDNDVTDRRAANVPPMGNCSLLSFLQAGMGM